MRERDPEQIYTELLVMRCQDNDKTAFHDLHRIWTPRFLRHIITLLKSEDPAKDIAQEGWFAIIKNIRKLRDPATFPAWAFRIMTNKSRDWQRKHIPIERHQIQQETDFLPDETTNQLETSGDIITDHIDLVRKSLEQLSLKQQELIHLFYYEQYSLDEIAHHLNIPSGTVKSRLFNARKNLKNIIESLN